MSDPRPSDLPPIAPPASGAGIHTAALCSALTMVLLTVLQLTVFRGAQPPAELGYVVNAVVSYAVGQAAGRIARARSVRAAHRAASSPSSGA